MHAWMGADLEAQIGAARKMIGRPRQAGKEEQRRCAMALRGEEKPARSDKIIGFRRPELADHHGGRLAFQRLFHRPKRIFRSLGLNENEPGGIKPKEREARPIEFALLAARKRLPDPDNRRLGFSRPRGETGGEA